MDKHEYLTGEDLEYRPGVDGGAKHEYSKLSEALNKGLKTMIKSTRLLNTTMIWRMILCIALINIVCLILIKNHQLNLNLIQ